MNIPDRIKSKYSQLNRIEQQQAQLKLTIGKLQESLGRIENRQLAQADSKNLSDNEFRVFSQWGEDGIIQFLTRNIELPNKIFIEFGVENYTESSTRFLLINNNWSGLIIDGSTENINYVKQDPIYWQHNLKAVASFIDKDNINQIITENGIGGEIGILSVDIDGNDYWVWQAIDTVDPAITIAEYNYRFGAERAVTTPYDPSFVRTQAHHSTIYYGASLKALCLLAHKKGYAFVGCNRAGNNAFFVRRDLKPEWMKELTVAEGYVSGQFRESRDRDGNLQFLSPAQERELLATLPLVEVE
jgi:hypothetical protein